MKKLYVFIILIIWMTGCHADDLNDSKVVEESEEYQDQVNESYGSIEDAETDLIIDDYEVALNLINMDALETWQPMSSEDLEIVSDQGIFSENSAMEISWVAGYSKYDLASPIELNPIFILLAINKVMSIEDIYQIISLEVLEMKESQVYTNGLADVRLVEDGYINISFIYGDTTIYEDITTIDFDEKTYVGILVYMQNEDGQKLKNLLITQ